jgi:hypothetical protein
MPDTAGEATAGIDVPSILTHMGAVKRNYWMADLDMIHIRPDFNKRDKKDPEYGAHIDLLTRNMLEEGFREDRPLLVKIANVSGLDRLVLVDGESRMLAVAKANESLPEERKIVAVPIIVKTDLTPEEELLTMVRSNQGRPFTPIELGSVIVDYMNLPTATGEKRGDNEVAAQFNVTPRYINDLLLLAKAPKYLKDLVAAGTVSSTLVREELRADPKKATARFKEAVAAMKAAGKDKITKKYLLKAGAETPAEGEPPVVKSYKLNDADFPKAAIQYALDTMIHGEDPTAQLLWLDAWSSGDTEAVADLEKYKGWPAGSTNNPKARTVKPPKKARKPKAPKEGTKAAENVKKDTAAAAKTPGRRKPQATAPAADDGLAGL